MNRPRRARPRDDRTWYTSPSGPQLRRAMTSWSGIDPAARFGTWTALTRGALTAAFGGSGSIRGVSPGTRGVVWRAASVLVSGDTRATCFVVRPDRPDAGPSSVAFTRARTNSRQVGKRSSGFRDSARATAGRSPAGRGSRSGSPDRCARETWTAFLPWNGRTPVSNSWYTTARLYWSLFW